MADTSISLQTNKFTPKGKHIILEMRGKPGGIMEMLLGLLRIESNTYFIVTRKDVQFRFSNLSGQTTITCPLDSVTGMLGSVSKPVWALQYGIIAILLGIGTLPFGLVFMLVGVALIAFFAMTKELVIAFSTADFAKVHGLGFEAGDMKLEQLLKRIEHINRVLLKAHQRQTVGNVDLETVSEDEVNPYDYEEIDESNISSEKIMINVMDDDEFDPISDELAQLDEIDDELADVENYFGTLSDDTEAEDPFADVFQSMDDDDLYDSPAFDLDDPTESTRAPQYSVVELVEMGREAYNGNDTAQALDYAEQAFKQDDESLDAIRLLAESYKALGNMPEAVKYRDLWRSLKQKV